ncbi:MAG: hypothetical protein AAFX87_17570 [Bacteroidota bacterium]
MKYKSANDFLNKLNLVYHAILAGPLLAFVFLYLEIQAQRMVPVLSDEGEIQTINILSFLLWIVLLGAGFLLFNRNLGKARMALGLSSKLEALFKYSMIKYVLLEGASIIAVFGLYLTHDVLFIVMYVVVLIGMSFTRPTPRNVVKDLSLEGEEKEILMHKKDIPEETT